MSTINQIKKLICTKTNGNAVKKRQHFFKIEKLMEKESRLSEKFILRDDSENPNQPRRAFIEMQHQISISSGTLVFASKAGNKAAYVADIQTRRVLFFFPKEITMDVLRRIHPHSKEEFFKLLADHVVWLYDVDYKVNDGPAKRLLLEAI